MNLPKSQAEHPSEPERRHHAFLDPGDYSRFLLHTHHEILFIMRSLMNSGNHITVHFNEGRDFLLTTIIHVDANQVTLDYGGDAAANRRALDANKLFCGTTHDGIRIQFVLHGLSSVDHGGRPAFRATFPESVLRLQRREYYRLTTPVANPIKCTIPVPVTEGAIAQSVVQANVVDLSGGGLAMMTPPPGLGFTVGDVFENCRIELPDVGVVVATIEVRNVFDVTLRSGSQVARAGCQFTNLPGTMMNMIQRYIIKVERERKARASGLS